MTLIRFLLSVALAFAICISVSAQSNYEKVHLHLDKPYYALGDTLWFKAYVVSGSTNHLSNKSGALYVDLINGKDSLIRSLKIPVTAGTSMGDFVLDEGVDPGNYRIRAYTQWMRNMGEAFFFDQSFRIAGLEKQQPIPTLKSQKARTKTELITRKDSLLQSDIQFFPEGGNLVNGITSKIAFKVTGMDGLGIDTKVQITDQAGKIISSFKSLYAGMGSFAFSPESGKNYSAKFTFPEGTEKTIPLPQAKEQGVTLGIYQPNRDSLLVRINTSQTGGEVKLMASSGIESIFSTTIQLSKTVNSIWLEKSAFPYGIAQFALLSPSNDTINERMVFIKTQEQLQLVLKTDKTQYNSREQLNINLKALTSKGKSSSGTFSVSVIDESKVPIAESAEHTIFSNLLLKSELRGYIEKPNYYFSTDTTNTDAALDNLMLTQGYRHFPAAEKPMFESEGLATTISGTVKTLGNKILPGAAVTLLSTKANIMKGTTTDSAGRFKFEGIVLTDSIKFAVQAKGPKNSSKVEIILDSIPKMQVSKNKNQADLNSSMTFIMKAYVENSRKQDSIYEKTGQLNRTQRLRQVNIRARKSTSDMTTQLGFTIPEGHADQTIDMRKEKPYANLSIMLTSLLRNVMFIEYKSSSGMTIPAYPSFRGSPLQIILDGRKLGSDEAVETLESYTLEPSDILKMEMVTSSLALGTILGGPSLLIYTKKDKKRKIYTPNLVNINPKGFNRVRSFYNPKYEVNANSTIPDLRTTIYWNPSIKTYATGEANFSFFNADGPGTYKLIIEGVGESGILGRQVIRYEVR